MSAFVLGKVHIDALLTAAVDADLYIYHDNQPTKVAFDNADEIGARLVAENVASVRGRYPDIPDSLDDMPGPIDNEYALAATRGEYHFARTQDFTPGQLLAAVTCYEYQSCEHDGWKGSFAEAFCDYLRGELCRKVPGYDGTWELTERGNPPISLFEMARRASR